MTDQIPNNESTADIPTIKSEPLDDFNVEFGSSSCIKIETVHGFEIKCEVDEEQIVEQYPEHYDTSLVKDEKYEEEVIDETLHYSTITERQFEDLMGNSIFIQQGSAESALKTSEIIEKSILSPKSQQQARLQSKSGQESLKSMEIMKKLPRIVVKSGINASDGKSRLEASKNLKIDVKCSTVPENLLEKAKTEPSSKPSISIQQKSPKFNRISVKNLKTMKILPTGLKIAQISGHSTSSVDNNSIKPEVCIKTEPNAEYNEGSSEHDLINLKINQTSYKIPENSQSCPETSKSKEVSSKLQQILSKTREALKKAQNNRPRYLSATGTYRYIPKFVDPNEEIRIKLAGKKTQTKIYQIPQITPKNSEKSPKIAAKEEHIEYPEQLLSKVKIKEEMVDDQEVMTRYQSDSQEILDTEEEPEEDYNHSYYPNQESKDTSDDLFQYNVVNSFKTDLATRRSVSHTVVTEGREKSKEEVAELARQELLKLEQEKLYEKDKTTTGRQAAAAAKAVAVPLNINGTRIVTKIVMPNIEKGLKRPGRPTTESIMPHQCKVCLIKFKTPEQLVAHKRLHDIGKAKLNTAEMTRNVYLEVRMKIEQIGNRKSVHVLLPNYDYAFIVTNSTANKLYMKCFRQTCDVKAYSTNDGKFYLKQGDKHCHGPDRDVILTRITEAKMNDLEKSSVINRQVHEAIIRKQKQNALMEERKNSLIERIKRNQEAASGSGIVKRRRLS